MASSSSIPEDKDANKPTVLITLGMAGSGKTTFVQVCIEEHEKS